MENTIDYTAKLKYHYRPEKGWVNDPNGLVYFNGYYHVFYQHSPNFEKPWNEPMHWGHARTKDFLEWEELPIALYPDRDYDSNGCWSGTAAVKDGVLYLMYASVKGSEKFQTVSVAYSEDGINFTKYENNPVIAHYPEDGGPDFRDPAVCRVGDDFYCVMATGNPATKTARLLVYKSCDLLDWKYMGIMSEWANCIYAECPSLVPAVTAEASVFDASAGTAQSSGFSASAGIAESSEFAALSASRQKTSDLFLLTASVCPIGSAHYFSAMYGNFADGRFNVSHTAEIDKGPDQYAGQVFRDHMGRNILISWVPGWRYAGYSERDIGCMSVPRELKLENGRITGYPVKELCHLLNDEDPCLERTDSGFIVKRTGREPLVYEGEIRELKVLRDGYIAEIFVNGGEEIYTVLL